MLFDAEGPGADHESLHVLQERALGLRAILCVHSTHAGPAFGGIRRLSYASEDEALADARRLAVAMSRKCALAGLPAGGAKMVVLDDRRLDVPRAYARIGTFVESLGGHYVCGPDVGTSEADLDRVRGQTRWVNPLGNDAGRSTALGVMAGLRGTLRATFGDAGFTERHFVVQGLGAVGLRVAKALVAAGARVSASDPEFAKCETARDAGVAILTPEDVLRTEADVLVPCALGGIITREVAEQVPVRAICGAANDQLASGDAAWALHGREIRYAPDFAVNIGAVAEGIFTVREGATDAVREKAHRFIDGVEATVLDILRRAEAEDAPSAVVATRMADERLRALDA